MIRPSTLCLALFFAIPAAGLTGCFDPEFDEGGFHCTPSEGADACPEGYRCLQLVEGEPARCSNIEPDVSIRLDKGEVKVGDPLRMTIAVTNFTLDAAAVGKDPVPGRGHVHVFFDATDNEWEVKTELSFEMALTAGLQPGPNTVVVQLFENNHQPVIPIVTAEADFTLVP